MNTAIGNVIRYFSKVPRNIFLLDALGAALTASSLFVVVRGFNVCFGMPTHILTYLSLIALVYCVYSMTCFILLKSNWTPFIRFISGANMAYCLLIMVLICVYYSELTKLGLTYFFLEFGVISVLVYIELNVAIKVKTLKRQTTDK